MFRGKKEERERERLPVNDQNLATRLVQLTLANLSSNRHIIEQAEAHRLVMLSMMSRRPNDCNGILDLSRSHRQTRLNGAARRQKRRGKGESIEVYGVARLLQHDQRFIREVFSSQQGSFIF
jgi:hypothetical protein